MPAGTLYFSNVVGGQPSVPCGDCACPVPATIDVVISGQTVCGCASTGGVSPIFYDAIADSGLTGLFTIPISVAGIPTWQGVIGTVDIQVYTDHCITPDGDPVTQDVTLIVNCSGGLYSVSVGTSAPPVSSGFFADTTNQPLDTPIDNSLTCDEGPAGIFNTPFILGTATVSIP